MGKLNKYAGLNVHQDAGGNEAGGVIKSVQNSAAQLIFGY